MRGLVEAYVIIQYLPLCQKNYTKPTCMYEKIAGKKVLDVLPYNTLMKSKNTKGTRQYQDLGSKDCWADTEFHYKRLDLRKGGKPQRKSWNVAMDWAQQVWSGF